MLNLISNIFLVLLFILPFGELFRWQLNNGITITGLDFIAGIIFLFCLFQYIKNKNYIHTNLAQPIGLFILICIFSLLINIPQLQPFQLFVSSLYLFRWIALTSIYFFIANQPKKNKQHFSMLMMYSGSLFLLFGFLQYLFFNDLRPFIFAGWDEHYLRLFSTFFDPNFAGIFLVLFFLLIVHMLFKEKIKQHIYGLSILGFFTCIGIFLTLSRSAFIALILGLLTYFCLRKNKKSFSVFGIVMIFLVIAIILLGNLPTEGAHIFRIPSSHARIESFQHAITVFSRNPFFGVGFNAYRYAQHRYGFLEPVSWQASHAAAGTDNSILFILATTGIFGLFAYGYLLYKMFRVSLFYTSEFFPVVFSSLVALLCGSMFVNALFYAPLIVWMWILYGLIEHT